MNLHATLLGLSLLLPNRATEEAPQDGTPELTVRPVLVQRGNAESSFGDDANRFEQTDVFKAAQAGQVDLRNPVHPFLAFSYQNNRLFYLFYNDVAHVPESRYLIQRIKRTKINQPAGRSAGNECRFSS